MVHELAITNKPMKILVADDDPIISKLLCEVLTDDGHKVSAVTNDAQVVKEVQRKDVLQTKNPQEHSILRQRHFIISG
jgi:CheY-like chemotaxis protein